ncbi:MAG: hypothetical protein ACF8R7_01525 [Phycisphaerales bacterium JB039]
MSANRNSRPATIFAACGLAAGLCGAASAQNSPYVINISGATLLQNFINAPAATNDFIDADADGVSRTSPTPALDQLAPFGLPPSFGGTSQWWITQYRVVGSVNGFQELIDWGGGGFACSDPLGFAVGADMVEISSGTAADGAFNNRAAYISAGLPSSAIFNAENPGGAPVRADFDTLQATYASPGTPSAGGIRVDIAPLDVPARWASQLGGDTPSFDKNPGQPGYGQNPRSTVDTRPLASGGACEPGIDHLLADLGALRLFDPALPPEPSATDIIFDTSIAFAPIACITNLGTGVEQLEMSEVRHLFATGRLPSGENLVAVTRDSGSGTRNGFNNSIGLDPSWGVGDNMGPLSAISAWDRLGPDWVPSSKGGSSRLEGTVQNHRLAVGYTGAERGVNSGWLTGGRIEIIAVRNDIAEGPPEWGAPTQFSRPTIDDVLDNDANGYIIGGPAVLATIGDPRSAPADLGGVGWADGEVRPGASELNAAMCNEQAAAYINNITRSVDLFASDPGADPTVFSPGEFLAFNFALTAATDFSQDLTDPLKFVKNNTNQFLQDFTRPRSVLGDPAYAAFGTVTRDGKVPTRASGVTYTDGVINGQNYRSQAGDIVAYGDDLTSRNRISGDFTGDGARDIDDAAEMIKAWQDRNGGPAWSAPSGSGPIAGAPGGDAVIEILGDFSGDGNFDAIDVRYWADGLAMVGGALDRVAGFTAVDDAFGGNFFGTTISGGGTYTNGDSRFDVAGSGCVTPGFVPFGADGIIDLADRDYIAAQFIGNPLVTDGEANWDDTAEAVGFDLSCDVTGDLIVNQADLDAIDAVLGICYADCDGTGTLDFFDFLCFQNAFATGDPYADCDGTGALDFFDFLCFQNEFGMGCP